ncbi:MAG: hypothetical protein PWP65_1729 [Clostridia bacterium]|nr:hypothetical protein [Clostridia bacterium]
MDRGMASEENLQLITGRGYHYVIAARQSERDRWLEEFEFEGEEGFIEIKRLPAATNPYQKKTRVEVKKKECGGKVFILVISEERAAKDRAIRETQEKRLLCDRAAAEKLDGSYLRKTDRTDISAEEAWHIYSLLTRTENAFRAMKSPLAEKPIFHQLKNRVRAHIFLCVLAYHLLVTIEKTLHDQGVHTSWGTVREILKTHQVVTVVLPTPDGKVLKIRRATKPEPEQMELYAKLGVPAESIKPKKTWLKQG